VKDRAGHTGAPAGGHRRVESVDHQLRVGSIAGIPLIIHYSWLAIFALITVNLTLVFGQEPFHPEWTLAERIVVAVATSAVRDAANREELLEAFRHWKGS
jgi:hypothetical protein